MLQGQRDLLTVGKLILSELAPVVSAQQGVFYIMNSFGRGTGAQASRQLRTVADGDGVKTRFKLGESLVGQAALEKRTHSSDQCADRLRESQLRSG